MKKLILVPFVFVSLMLTGCVITSGIETNTTTVVHQPNPTFRDLDSYGTWVNIPDYGTVWKPYDEVNWQPYSDGQWVWTDQGWMWDSNEPYGWIVYHYGNWQFTDYDGWFWVPSYDWSPARVNWYRSNGYVGWAPVPPPAMGRSVVYNDAYVSRVWVVVPEQNFAGQNIVRYRNRSYVPGAQVLRSNAGGRAPDVRDIERVSNRRIDVVQPTREQVNAGNRQITRVRVQNNNNTPVSPSTIRNQPTTVTPPATRDQSNPVRTTPTTPNRNQPSNPPVVNPQKPASNPPEINDRRPVNNSVQKQPVERNNPTPAINNSGNANRDKIQNNRGTDNTNQKNSTRDNSGRTRNGAKRQPAAAPGNKQPVVAPANNQPATAPVDKKDDKKDKRK
jgi:hypothetical protein